MKTTTKFIIVGLLMLSFNKIKGQSTWEDLHPVEQTILEGAGAKPVIEHKLMEFNDIDKALSWPKEPPTPKEAPTPRETPTPSEKGPKN